MSSPDSNTQTSGRQRFMILALLLLIVVPARPARAENDECREIAASLTYMNGTAASESTAEMTLAKTLQRRFSNEAKACWSVMFFQSRNANKIDDLTQWQKERIAEFKIDQTPASLWNLCYQSKCFKNIEWYLEMLNTTCKLMAGSSCDQVEKEYNIAKNPPLPPPPPPLLPKKLTAAEKVGKGFLIGAVVLGSASMILGAMHMITPVFQEPVSWASCEANGLRLPCVADRFPTGGGLLGGGAALVIGSAVTLGLKF